MRLNKYIAVILALIIVLTGCGGGSSEATSAEPDTKAAPETKSEDKAGEYKAPKMAKSKFHKDEAEGYEGAMIDISAVKKGYVAVSAESGERLKFQVLKGDDTYNYDIDSDGDPSVFPLQCGNGTYTFRIMENISGNKYACLYQTEAEVKIKNKFDPFLRPSDYVNYNKDSECVKKAKELAAGADDVNEVVTAVFEYITSNVKYDREKAENVKQGYLPTPDETLSTGKGICFDYASLAAAMLRSQGIPTKVIFGYVSPNDLYHAWNMFYTEETGWVTVKFEVKGKEWNRLDMTFSAGGTDSKFIGDGSNYSDVYNY